jgi:tetratricopeptide (TPR) repeat protein
LEKGERFSSKKMWSQAASEWEKIILIEPRHKKAKDLIRETRERLQELEREINQGNKYFNEGYYEQAIIHFSRVLEIEPDNMEIKQRLELINILSHVKLEKDKEPENIENFFRNFKLVFGISAGLGVIIIVVVLSIVGTRNYSRKLEKEAGGILKRIENNIFRKTYDSEFFSAYELLIDKYRGTNKASDAETKYRDLIIREKFKRRGKIEAALRRAKSALSLYNYSDTREEIGSILVLDKDNQEAFSLLKKIKRYQENNILPFERLYALAKEEVNKKNWPKAYKFFKEAKKHARPGEEKYKNFKEDFSYAQKEYRRWEKTEGLYIKWLSRGNSYFAERKWPKALYYYNKAKEYKEIKEIEDKIRRVENIILSQKAGFFTDKKTEDPKFLPKDIKKKLLKGNRFFSEGKYPQAIEVWQEVLKIFPQEKETLENMIQHTRAIMAKDIKQDKIRQKNYDNYMGLGEEALVNKIWEEAFLNFQLALRYKEKDEKAREKLNYARQKLKVSEDKQETLSQEKNQLYLKGNKYYKEKNWDKAIEHFEKALAVKDVKDNNEVIEHKYKTANYEKYLIEAKLKEKRGLLNEALASYQTAAMFGRPGAVDVYIARVKQKISHGKYNLWYREGLNKEKEFKFSEANVCFNAALLYYSSIGNPKEKIKLQQRIIDNNFINENISNTIDIKIIDKTARILYSRKLYKEAENKWFYIINIEEKQNNPVFLSKIYSYLAKTKGKKGEKEEALKLYNKALSYNDKNLPALNELAGLYRISGKPVKAEEACRKALKINPFQLNTLAELAGLYSVENNKDKIKNILNIIKDKDISFLEDNQVYPWAVTPEIEYVYMTERLSSVYILLCEIYFKLNLKEGKKFFQRALKLGAKESFSPDEILRLKKFFKK